MNEVIGKQLAGLMVPPDGQYLQYQKTGKIRVLATSGTERHQFFPTVPTFKEAGYPSMVLTEWLGAFMPANTPHAIVERASRAIRAAMSQKDVASKLAELAYVPSPTSDSELAQSLSTHYAFWKKTVKDTDFKLL